ncbi:MAG: leucyl aminopeptidase family protein [Pseudomonadota bacterium]
MPVSDFLPVQTHARNAAPEGATALTLVQTNAVDDWLRTLSPEQRAWVRSNDFTAESGATLRLLPEADEAPSVVVGWDGKADLNTLGGLPLTLPEGIYRPTQTWDELALLGWWLGAYQFDRYKAARREPAVLVVPQTAAAAAAEAIARAVWLCRDLINTPAADMLPSDLAAAAQSVAQQFNAGIEVTAGDDLLKAQYRTIHAVGRAATDAPRLIDLRWGNTEHPRVTLVGKGICFDSGGLDLKPSSAMRTMTKDMGGAAQALALAQLIMARQLPVRLRLLIAAAENAVAGNAFRPGDIITTYSGRTVEIDNTDAEGRLVLCDALSLATEEEPALIVDFATLTGSARSAVGAEVSAMFCNRDEVADGVYAAGQETDDPVWRLPLHAPYRSMLKSTIADTLNSAPSPFAGAITAALYLEDFVEDQPWLHFDLMAFNSRSRPARPEGGEAMAMRAVFHYLDSRYGARS